MKLHEAAEAAKLAEEERLAREAAEAAQAAKKRRLAHEVAELQEPTRLAGEELAEYKARAKLVRAFNEKDAGKLEHFIREVSSWLKEDEVNHWRAKLQSLQSYIAGLHGHLH